jgi:hypothetical protein
MNVTALLDGQTVTIVSMSVDGRRLWISFVDEDGNLKLTKKSISLTATEPNQTVATNAVVN